MEVSLKSPQHSPALLPQLLTNISLQGCGYCDIINVGQGCGVEQDRAVNSSIVEEIKSCVLNKVALRIPGLRDREREIRCLERANLYV